MPLFRDDSERALAIDLATLVYVNPFLDQRIEHERRILGDVYITSQPYWNLEPDLQREANIDAITARCEGLVAAMQSRLRAGLIPPAEDLALHDDVVVYMLYERYRDRFLDLAVGQTERVTFYSAFRADVAEYLDDRTEAAHLFACLFQVRRAFHHIFRHIVGRSLPAARLRAAVWQSIFSFDMRRYRRSLYLKMGDVATLITGPTGTGKELVARAIGLSRYVPFDPQRERFAAGPFISVNLSALSPTLIESELFGHRKGSFTGAVSDRIGFLESCGPHGTVFLDEIGEVEPAVQVKLLRVLQSRTFQRIGETATRQFEGKIITATNRDLAAEISKGRFREDFFYRLCADTVATPPLHEQLAGSDDELAHLVRFISARVAGAMEAEGLTEEVLNAIATSPGRAYRWPGNFRELEQCVRSVMLRGEYRPAAAVPSDARDRITRGVLSGTFSADDLLRNYTTLLYATTRNYSHVAEKLGVDRRTVRAKVDPDLLAEL